SAGSTSAPSSGTTPITPFFSGSRPSSPTKTNRSPGESVSKTPDHRSSKTSSVLASTSSSHPGRRRRWLRRHPRNRAGPSPDRHRRCFRVRPARRWVRAPGRVRRLRERAPRDIPSARGAAPPRRNPAPTPRRGEDFRAKANEPSSELRKVGVVDVETDVLQGTEIDVSVDLLVLLVEHQLPAGVDEGPIPEALAAVDLRPERTRAVEEGIEHCRADGEAVVRVVPRDGADDARSSLRQVHSTQRITHPVAHDLHLDEAHFVVARERREIVDGGGKGHQQIAPAVEQVDVPEALPEELGSSRLAEREAALVDHRNAEDVVPQGDDGH